MSRPVAPSPTARPASPSSPLLQGNLRNCILASVFASPVGFLSAPGNHLVAALLTGKLAVAPVLYGWLISLPFWANALQAVLTPWIQHCVSSRRLSIVATTTHGCAWLGIGVAVGFMHRPPGSLDTALLVVLFGVAALASTMAAIGWTAWVHEWVPSRVRGRFFGQSSRWAQTAHVAFLLLSAAVLGQWADSLLPLQALLIGAALLRLGSAASQVRIRELPALRRNEERLPWRAQLALLRHDKPYLRLVSFYAAWGASPAFFGPFMAVFMFEELHLTVSQVGQMMVAASVCGMIALPFWGRMADRHGHKPVMLFGLIIWTLSLYGWCFLTPERTPWLWPIWVVGGLFGSGFTLGWFNLQLKLLPPAAKTLGVSLNLALSSICAAIAPVVGGHLLEALFATGFPRLGVYQSISAVQPTLALLSCLVLLRVHEPAAGSLREVVGAMSSLRSLSALLGLGFITNRLFTTRAPRRTPSRSLGRRAVTPEVFRETNPPPLPVRRQREDS